MICYRDMTFCSASKECKSEECPRKLKSEDYKKEEEKNLPICYAEFWNDCLNPHCPKDLKGEQQ